MCATRFEPQRLRVRRVQRQCTVDGTSGFAPERAAAERGQHICIIGPGRRGHRIQAHELRESVARLRVVMMSALQSGEIEQCLCVTGI